MLRFVLRLSGLVLFLIVAGLPGSSRAQTNGGLQTETHVSGTVGSIFDRQTPQSAATGPIAAYDTIVASINGAPANYLYAQAIAIADWQPGVVKASGNARIFGLCIPNGSGGCEGPGTSQVGAKAAASTKTVGDPGVASPTLVQNNLTLTGTISRLANFLSSDTQTAYVNGTIPDAKATFTYLIRQLQFNPDAGHDIFVRLAGGGVTLTSHYDGTVTMTSNGFASAPTTWTGAPLTFTTPAYTLQPGKDLEVTFSVNVDTAFQYSLRTADEIVSHLAFQNSFGFSSDPLAPAFTSSEVAMPGLGILGGVYSEPVPEPGLGAMLAAGLGGLAASARRRSRPSPRPDR